MISKKDLEKNFKFTKRDPYSVSMRVRMSPAMREYIQKHATKFGYKSLSEFMRDIILSSLDAEIDE